MKIMFGLCMFAAIGCRPLMAADKGLDGKGWRNVDFSSAADSSNKALRDDRVYFGFLNKSGDKLLGFEDSRNHPAKLGGPGHISRAACTNGRIVSLGYIGRQERGAKDNGRQTFYNFSQSAGELYGVKGTTGTEHGGDCFLFSEGFLKDHKIYIPRALGMGPLDKKALSRISEAKGRSIDNSWALARLDDGATVAMVQFENRGRDALLSLVALMSSRLIFHDIHGTVGEDGTWRIEDEGKFHPESYKIVFAFRDNHEIGIGASWTAPEGDSLSFVRSDGERFQELARGTFYQAPN